MDRVNKAASTLLTPALLRELGQVSFLPKNRVEGRHAGRHKSPLRGSSTEFRDYREYSPGDDPARVDWRVFARNDRHVIRTYEQEAQTGCVVLLDQSASMDFGNPESKAHYAARLTACLCHLVVRSQDQAGLCLFNDSEENWFAPAGNHRHFQGLLQALEHLQPQGSADLTTALQRLRARLFNSSTLVLISDFYCSPSDLFQSLNPFLHRNFDVHLLHVLDPQELQLPGELMLRFQDLESGGRLVSDPRSLQERYQKILANHLRAFRQLAIRRGVHYRQVSREQPMLQALSELTS